MINFYPTTAQSFVIALFGKYVFGPRNLFTGW